MTRPSLEERCAAALTAVELEDCIGIDTFDQALRSVMKLVERERADARRLASLRARRSR